MRPTHGENAELNICVYFYPDHITPPPKKTQHLPCCPSTVKTAASFSVESVLKKKTTGSVKTFRRSSKCDPGIRKPKERTYRLHEVCRCVYELLCLSRTQQELAGAEG